MIIWWPNGIVCPWHTPDHSKASIYETVQTFQPETVEVALESLSCRNRSRHQAEVGRLPVCRKCVWSNAVTELWPLFGK